MSEILQGPRPAHVNRPRAKHWGAHLPGGLAPSRTSDRLSAGCGRRPATGAASASGPLG